ncbi:class I SAM-dependent methyltransferase [Campylobacter sp. CCS1377]|uniref:Class I SAM-dependent methyltransferase n=1 Tax=Campylobacter sp. CCS1377 TaxID=3158229 RepID=A0AAU7E8Q2_9BACT|nr:methyltransferase regulatory domain-containing protein [Campylobacter jejuni]
MNWNQGYVTDINYTRGYCKMLNPLRIKLCFLAHKLLPPKIENACELGFGQGISLNFNAASTNVNWYGTDFNPSQAAFAKNMADISGASVNIFDDSFEELLQRDDLPKFDFIALHGIYSWVSPKVREQITAFIHKNLSIGGVCYISYNCQAGWGSVTPFRNLLRAYSTNLTAGGKASSIRAREGLNFVSELVSLPSTEVIKSPRVIGMLQTLQRMDDNYLAHELLNEHQYAFDFLEISKELGNNAKLNFASYANFNDHLTNIQLSKEERELLAKVAYNQELYEMLKDLIFANNLRSDYWVKGAVRLNDAEWEREMLDLRIVLTIPLSEANYSIQTYKGTLDLNKDFYTPLFEILQDNEPKLLKDIKASLEKTLKREVNLIELLEALIALSSKDYIKLAQDEATIEKAQNHTQKLNKYILERSTETFGFINHLISPVTGEAISLNQLDLMFVYASTLKDKEKDWVEFVANVLQEKNEGIIKDGKEIPKEEMKAELEKQAKKLKTWLAVFKKLKII